MTPPSKRKAQAVVRMETTVRARERLVLLEVERWYHQDWLGTPLERPIAIAHSKLHEARARLAATKGRK
jgi:hypothetical protein